MSVDDAVGAWSAGALAVSAGAVCAAGSSAVAGSAVISAFAGEIDGDSTAGNPMPGCILSAASPGVAAVLLPEGSISLRLAIAARPRLAVHQSVTMFGYQLVTNRLRQARHCSNLNVRTLHGVPSVAPGRRPVSVRCSGDCPGVSRTSFTNVQKSAGQTGKPHSAARALRETAGLAPMCWMTSAAASAPSRAAVR